MMRSLPRTQAVNPFKGLLFSMTTPYGSHGFLIPPPGDSRAAPASAARGFIRRTLSLLKPPCKPSTFSQQTTRADTLGAVAQAASPNTGCLVDHAKYGGMPRDTRRISPVYCSGQRLSPAVQSTKFAPRWFVASNFTPRWVSLISHRVGFLIQKQGRGATCQS